LLGGWEEGKLEADENAEVYLKGAISERKASNVNLQQRNEWVQLMVHTVGDHMDSVYGYS
jgi:hypothetical protein